MSTEFHAVSAQRAERGAPQPSFVALRKQAAALLRAQAAEIAERWEAQSRTVALRRPETDDQPTPPSPASALVMALAAALAPEGAASDDLVSLGFAFGVEAFGRGGSLHHALKGLDLLSAMILYAMEAGIEAAAGTAADGVRLSRRLQQASSLLGLAATKGYTEAMGDAMRDRFRHLRHDLRNPLGTIKSVLAMMDDETMPADARAHPRFRAMAKRNARTLGDLIAERLSDTEAIAPALAEQRVSLRALACGVRRDLRAHAEACGVTVVVVGSTRAHVLVDAIGLELLLHELLLAAIQEASAGDELHVELGEIHDARASVSLRGVPPRAPVSDARMLERLSVLVGQMRGALEVEGETIRLLFPVRPMAPADSPTERADARPSSGVGSAGGKPSHDVRRADQGEHGQPSAL